MNRSSSRKNWVRWLPFVLLLTIAWGTAIAALPYAPEQIPTHWNIAGEPDSFSSRFQGLFMIPALTTVFLLLRVILPRIDPKRANYRNFSTAYYLFTLGGAVLLTAVHLMVVATALGISINISLVAGLLCAVLMVWVGNLLGKFRPNWFIGIRTPWTLSSPDVWTRTHRVVGRLMVLAGIAIFFVAAFLPSTWLPVSIAAGGVAIALTSYVYSFVVWRGYTFRQPRDEAE